MPADMAMYPNPCSARQSFQVRFCVSLALSMDSYIRLYALIQATASPGTCNFIPGAVSATCVAVTKLVPRYGFQ